MPVNQREGSDFRHLAWLHPYYLDWGPCGQEVFMIRGFVTILRWFDDPADRWFQIDHVRQYVREERRKLDPQLQKNLADLMDADTPIGPWIPAGLFGLFLQSLAFGDLIDGGPTDPGWPPNLVAIRPGFFFAATQWRSLLPAEIFPWPFWVFPATAPPEEE